EATHELLRRGANPALGQRPPIFAVIYDQKPLALELLLDHGVDVNSVDETRHSREIHYELKETRKLYAVICSAYAQKINTHVPQSVPLLRSLVTRGADLYLPLNEEETIIHFLFEFPELPVQNALLENPCVQRIDFNRRDQRGRTVLMAACASSHLDCVKPDRSEKADPDAPSTPVRILEHGGDPILVDNSGKTALHHLLLNEHPLDDVVIQFINLEKVRPILFVKDNDGYTPLHYALRFLRPAICQLLLSKGADLLEADPKGRTTLHHIARQIHRTTRPSPSISQTDLPADYPDQCLALWNKCVAQGGDINAADKDGNTPLHLYLLSTQRKKPYSEKQNGAESTTACHLVMYDKLFPPDRGVDIFAVNNEGETMLHVIARRTGAYCITGSGHDKELFLAIMAKGLDPLKEDGKGRSALDVASACEKDDIVAALGRKSG
ncbi:ankyrin repeat-containing domain protein, partial [Podospora australis]